MDILPNFVVFEGGDGAGTTTQLEILTEKAGLPGREKVFFPTFEPTGGAVGRLIRSALGGEFELRGETLALLFAADRNEHLYGKGGIVERCKGGTVVVSDRYVPSSLVYQGIACGEEIPRDLNRRFPAPQLLFYFDLEPALALERIKKRENREIFEHREFQEKVRRAYLELLPHYEDAGVRVIRLDASKAVLEVAADIWKIMEKLFD